MDIVQRKILTVETLVDIVPNLRHDGIVGRVIVEERNMREGKIGQDHVIVVLALLV